MLSQSESKAGNYLRRSKSSSSVQDRRRHPLTAAPLDPETSRAHAMIAAHRAMGGSHDRVSIDLDRSNSAASRRSITRAQPSSGMQLHRQRSLLHERNTVLQRNTQPPPAYDALSIHLQNPISGFGGVGESYGAEPSSYRKLRKARSMLTPRKQVLNVGFETPMSQAQTLKTTPTAPRSSLRVRLQKSLSALRPSSRVSCPTPRPKTEIGNHEEAVRLAREQMLGIGNRSPVTPNTTLHQPKTRRSEKPFRRSVRSGHQVSESHHDMESSSKRARSLSATIRDGFKKVLGRPAKAKEDIPPQHLEASRAHFNEIASDQYQQTTCGNYTKTDQHFAPEGSPIDLVQQSIPEKEIDEISETIRRSTSGESLTSTSRSRVTSWSNSTSTASLNVRDGILPRNRLSVIKEDGSPHQPSCSAGRHIGGVNVFQEPLRSHNSSGQVLAAPDSQRLYSALVKRLEPDEVEGYYQNPPLDDPYPFQSGRLSARAGNISTIREVSGDSSSASMGTIEQVQGQEACPETQSHNDPENRANPWLNNADKHLQKLFDQEEQSNFFPFSSEIKPATATESPFRRLLNERHNQREGGPVEQENDESETVIYRPTTDNLKQKYGLSSESLYSQLTNGEPNPNYVRPADSTDELGATAGESIEGTGMATILPASHTLPSQKLLMRPSMTARSSTDRREFKGWLENQMSAWQRPSSKGRGHYRERAQIDPNDLDIGPDDKLLSMPEMRPELSTKRFPLFDLKEISTNTTSAPNHGANSTKGQGGIPKRASLSGLATLAGVGIDEQRKISSSMRKISPSNVARMIKKRASQILPNTNHDTRKENKPVTQDDSPPLSTPGPFVLQMKRSNGRLRKRASEGGLATTPTNAKKPHQSKHEETNARPRNESPEVLAAHLNRPLSGDASELDRPFCSMYFGKGNAEDSKAADGELSLAPQAIARLSDGYGGLGPDPHVNWQTVANETVLPPISLRSKGSGFTISAGSRRMVSNFLRSRRAQKDSGSAELLTDASGPAFV